MTPTTHDHVDRVDRRRSLTAGLMIGAAVMAAADEVVFHQLLGWHHFYDRSTPDIGLLSDGVLQAVYLVLLVAGFFLLADVRRDRALAARSAWASFVLGLGVFHLFDGVVDHKVLRVHQIRYGTESLLPYDLAWNLVGAALVLAGGFLVWRTRHEANAQAQPDHNAPG